MENENLVRIVLNQTDDKGITDQFAENVTTDDINRYFHQLSSIGLNKLTKELDRISEERSSIINQTQELAFQEYPTFIETAQCTQDIFQTFQKVNQSTERLTTNLTTLKEKCIEFTLTAQSLSAARRLTSLALSRHTQLLEILELPQLMDTCVRNGYYEEALDLASYVARLERKLAYIPLITKVAQEVQSCTRLMLSQLIAQLRMPAQLPHCLKVVGYLRRMEVFSEEELRLKFLQARDAWYKSTIEEIPKEDAYQHVLKTIELSRVHLFDIATQYRAIFTDEDPLVLANQDVNTNESAIFHSWIILKVTDFLLTLQCDLPKISPQSLESVFGQCMYFGLSFGRVGSDFRVLLIPLFAQVVFDRFDNATNKTELQFSEVVSNFSLARTGSALSNNSSLYTQATHVSADQVQPPYSLMKFTPLVELCNEIIAAFNELRLCAPVQLVEPVTRKLDRTFHGCSQVLADFQRHEKEAFTAGEEQEFSKCLQLYQQDFLPFVEKILQLMFSTALISAQTGFPSGEITKQHLGVLNKQYILQPISHLLINEEPISSIATIANETTELHPIRPEPETSLDEIMDPTSDVSPVNDSLARSEIPKDSHHLLEEGEEETESEVSLLTEVETVVETTSISENSLPEPVITEEESHDEDHSACVAPVLTEIPVEREVILAEQIHPSQAEEQEAHEGEESGILAEKSVEGELVGLKLENLSSELIDFSPIEPSAEQ